MSEARREPLVVYAEDTAPGLACQSLPLRSQIMRLKKINTINGPVMINVDMVTRAHSVGSGSQVNLVVVMNDGEKFKTEATYPEGEVESRLTEFLATDRTREI